MKDGAFAIFYSIKCRGKPSFTLPYPISPSVSQEVKHSAGRKKMVKMGNTPASGCGTSPMNPSPKLYHKRSISTSCLDLQMYGSLDMVPMMPGHHRSTSDPLTYNSVAPFMNLHQTDRENTDLKMVCDENRSEPTIEEYKLLAQRALLQQKMEYINNLGLLTAKIKMTVDALERNVDALKRLTAKYIQVKKERDSLLYILSKIHKGK